MQDKGGSQVGCLSGNSIDGTPITIWSGLFILEHIGRRPEILWVYGSRPELVLWTRGSWIVEPTYYCMYEYY